MDNKKFLFRKISLILTAILLFSATINADVLRVDAKNLKQNIISGHLKMGNPGPEGKEITVNNKYISIGGKPVIPVMGEMHFSRCPKGQWEDRILKMKANGINIIATYVFWIHHEETEGVFDWSGNNDLRSFIKLCHKHGLFVYPRLGPWCHGEVRNGGTPDWIFTKKGLVDRSNNEKYQFYADRLYSEIAKQMSGLYYKDGGPVIGVQLENEYRRGPGGNAHILWLKKTANKYGIDVPLYTVTGWGNASVPQDEVIPLFGGYPEEPWVTNLIPAKENLNFCFDAPLNDEGIGADVAAKEKGKFTDYSRYPYLTCEIGLGNQISYHRRPIINDIDGAAMTYAKIGSGSNLPGYYVFTGGQNPKGKYTSLEENQDETGYWNQYCDISYDFQAPIRETGELAGSYHQIKKLHYFLNEFGDRLATMTPVIPSNQKSTENLQWAIRSDGESGFVFGLNYYRNFKKPLQRGVQFEVSLEKEKISFPSKPVEIVDSCMFIWPFNIALERINEATATLNQSKLMLFPKLNGTAGTTHKKLSDNTTQSDNLKTSLWEAGFNASWELDIWGKLSSAKRSSFASLLKTEAAGRLIKTEVIANIAKLYYSLLALDKKLEITINTVEIREKDVNSMKLLKESAKVDGAALVQSQANLYSAQVSIPDIRQSIRETENALCLILGRIPGNINRGKLENQKAEVNLNTGIPAQLVANRPDVQESEFALREAFENVNVARASIYPSISLTANGGLSSLEIKDFLDKSVFYNLIGNLVQPIFNAGQNKAKLEIAKARQRETFLSFRKALLNAGNEVSDALYSYQMAVEKEISREKQVTALQDAVTFTKELLIYSSKTDYTDVLMSEQSLLTAQLSSVNDKTQKLNAIVNLYKALGGGWK